MKKRGNEFENKITLKQFFSLLLRHFDFSLPLSLYFSLSLSLQTHKK